MSGVRGTIERMFDGWSDGRVVSGVADSYRQVAVGMAAASAGIAELLQRRTVEEVDREADVRSLITAFERTVVEVGAALRLPSARARELVHQADVLHTRLPAVAALLAAGEVDYPTVLVVVERTDLVAEQHMARLDAALAERIRGWARWSRRLVRDAVDGLVAEVDAAAIKRRSQAAFDERRVTVAAGLDGMAAVRARMSAAQGAAMDARWSMLAKAVCPADPRSLTQRRADVFDALNTGRGFGCGCGDPGCPQAIVIPPAEAHHDRPATTEPAEPAGAEPIPAPAPPIPAPTSPIPAPAPPGPGPVSVLGRQVVLNVVAAADTVAGHSDAPGYLAGYGIIDAQLVRELAREATRRLVEAPPFDERQALTYRPSAALARFIRARDLTCRFPGCDVAATRCDVDHTIPFDHENPAAGGQTVPWNLACYCRQHHRHKTHDTGWRDRQLADATIIWTSPSGHQYRTRPAGVGLFPGLGRAQHRSEAQRIAAARRRLNAHRDASEHNSYRNQKARDEIRDRRWRNGFRCRYLLFKGDFAHNTPSKSPFARFVNDPLEPETLPPNWQPPPPPNNDPDEPPPF
ncbi:hypothetical protein MPP7335_00700 [Mycolicibacterium parafortuitum]|uniref:HNH nuclease domain-containing protein n=2 Tax=Mycolicibacterium parafortuitum TaxID=39692 RepID=A0A375YCW6_MYCPF|nr:hypothetical protein MPP7335_00700 [Mycolicibacterium parafortuitum]